MVSESFNKDYTKYWKEAVNKSIDGTVIADKSIAKIFLDKINLRRDITSLDLGCSYGRMYDLLNLYSSEVHGVDVDKYAIKEAKKYNYKSLQVSSATKTNYSKDSFQLIFCWAVFEVLDPAKTLIEMNRLLSEGGHVVLTAKNDCYYNDDLLAFTAEKNAFLKDFPNSFINLPSMINSLHFFGFETEKLYIFNKRGDMGLAKYIEINNFELNEIKGYEFLLILKKTKNTRISTQKSNFSSKFSRTSKKIAINKGHSSVDKLFRSIGYE